MVKGLQVGERSLNFTCPHEGCGELFSQGVGEPWEKDSIADIAASLLPFQGNPVLDVSHQRLHFPVSLAARCGV